MTALEKATITNTISQDVVEVLFNPEEYSVSGGVSYAEAAVPGLSAPLIQFVNGNLRTLEMELFLDTYEEHCVGSRRLNEAKQDVRVHVRKVTALMDIEPSTHAPPVVIFVWGSLTFTGVLASVRESYVMFLADGVPVRARLQVTFNEYTNPDLEPKDTKRETADYTAQHVVRPGETVSSIAAAVYGSAEVWRPIALFNDIENPNRLEVGTRILVPSLPYTDAISGVVHQ